MIQTISKGLLAAAALAFAGPLHAQTMSSEDQVAVQQALNRGQLMFAFDQAAWHATDALMADAKALGRTDELGEKFGGWIVTRKGADSLEVLFFDRAAAAPQVLYVVVTSSDGKVIRSHRFADRDKPRLDAATLRMVKARKIVIDSLKVQAMLQCAGDALNSVVLPPETPDGPIPVYLLSPQTDANKVPFGGHARILVAADGTAGPVHAFTKGCMDLPTREAENAPEGLVATLVLDPRPTEVSVFTMLAAGLPLFIGTDDGRIWSVEAPGGQAAIRLVQSKGKQK